MPKVVIRKSDEDSAKMVIPELIEVFSAGVDFKGKRVLVKPNMLGPFPPERHCTTNCHVIQAIVIRLKELGADVTVGDNPGVRGYSQNEKSARVSGIMDAANGTYKNIGLETVEIPVKSRFFDRAVVSKEVLETDFLLTVPKLKTHTLTKLTGAVKNAYGFLVGAEKARLHYKAPNSKDFSEAVVDIYAIRPPDMVIMDAIVVMEGNGPSTGRPKEAGYLFASDNGVAADMAAAKLMGVKPESIHTNRIAAGRKDLGNGNLSNMEIDGKLEPIRGFKMPSNFVGERLGPIFNRIIFPIIDSKPDVDQEKCTKCKVCVQACPVDTIEMTGKDDTAFIIDDKCISCFCCNELCPEGAIEVRSRAFRLIRRLTV